MVSQNHQTVRTTYAVLALILVVAGWYLITWMFSAGFIFFFLLILTLILYALMDSIWGDTKEPIIGYQRLNIGRSLAYGGLSSLLFLFLFVIQKGLSIGLPLASAAPGLTLDQRFFTTVILAPTVEEPLFRGAILTLFFNSLYNPKKHNQDVALWGGAIATSVFFAGYHSFAYGGAAQYAMFGAFIFSMVMCWVAARSRNLIGSTMAHGIVNSALTALKFVVVG